MYVVAGVAFTALVLLALKHGPTPGAWRRCRCGDEFTSRAALNRHRKISHTE